MDIEIDLPKAAKKAENFVFDVIDADGNQGFVMFSKRPGDDD